MEVTTKPTGSTHTYVLIGEKWAATVLNEFAEECREAIASAVANRTHTEEQK